MQPGRQKTKISLTESVHCVKHDGVCSCIKAAAVCAWEILMLLSALQHLYGEFRKRAPVGSIRLFSENFFQSTTRPSFRMDIKVCVLIAWVACVTFLVTADVRGARKQGLLRAISVCL